MRFVHRDCLDRWRDTDTEHSVRCSVCKDVYTFETRAPASYHLYRTRHMTRDACVLAVVVVFIALLAILKTRDWRAWPEDRLQNVGIWRTQRTCEWDVWNNTSVAVAIKPQNASVPTTRNTHNFSSAFSGQCADDGAYVWITTCSGATWTCAALRISSGSAALIVALECAAIMSGTAVAFVAAFACMHWYPPGFFVAYLVWDNTMQVRDLHQLRPYFETYRTWGCVAMAMLGVCAVAWILLRHIDRSNYYSPRVFGRAAHHAIANENQNGMIGTGALISLTS